MKSIFDEVKANNYLSINHNVPLFIIPVPSSTIINGAHLNPKVSNLISSTPPPYFFSLSLPPIQVKALEIRTQSNENY